ncbi:hypothetical protein KNP414_06846 [Paenibacillus mucilaginosus KNP414]|uniref:Uncharacterized protein n=1 Tax=Paenibacillus mucilaginosus (strain KNP414) TaxID=1036673 RepID=F8FEP7_PAEMK|nr:hypothetical protein KNP414_06846 [Paenibacillus mucilaginosus KNP414]
MEGIRLLLYRPGEQGCNWEAGELGHGQYGGAWLGEGVLFIHKKGGRSDYGQ